MTVGWTTTIATKGKFAGQEVPKQLYQTIGYFETKQEAMDALALHRVNPVSPRANITLEELYQEWAAVKYKNLSRSTANNYRLAWKYLQQLGKIKFKDLRTAHWQAAIDKCIEANLSRSTLEKIRTLAVLLYKHAMKNDIVSKNYAQFIELPKAEKTEKERFTDLEVKKIEDAAGTVPWADTILIMIYTGMRISEMLSLTQFNVNLDLELITGGIKTEAGKNRAIPIHPKIMKYMRQWYEKGGETLICDSNGRRISTKRYREKMYYPALEEIGVRKLVPHSCRHTFCSMLAEANVDPLYIQRLAGHTDYAFTANTYTHPEIEELKKAISKI